MPGGRRLTQMNCSALESLIAEDNERVCPADAAVPAPEEGVAVGVGRGGSTSDDDAAMPSDV